MVNAMDARPLEAGEYQAQVYIDPLEVEMAMSSASYDEAREAVKPLGQRKTDRIILYHPDPLNPSSIYTVPMNPQERRFVVARLLQKTKVIQGKVVRWCFPTPQVEPVELPLRCFIQGCDRRGGFQSRAQLIAHVTGKHSNEAPMYQRLIDALMEQIYKDIPPDQYAMYGLTPPEDDTPKRGRKAAE